MFESLPVDYTQVAPTDYQAQVCQQYHRQDIPCPCSVSDMRTHMFDTVSDMRTHMFDTVFNAVYTNATQYPLRGKHIAKPPSQWSGYGLNEEWDCFFEYVVLMGVEDYDNKTLTADNFIKYFEDKSHLIAWARREINESILKQFGVRRNDEALMLEYTERHFYTTRFNATNSLYGYASPRALKLDYSDSYVEKLGEHGKQWLGKKSRKYLRYGLVHGKMGDKTVELTQYIFYSIKNSHTLNPTWFGEKPEDYIGINRESGFWLHTERRLIPDVITHINGLIKQALEGDLSMIPRIHWWYAHLAPTIRGSGGTAELIIKTICRIHGHDLPPWETGVAPAVETLLEPSEEIYCQNYHRLFSFKQQEILKTLFQKKITPEVERWELSGEGNVHDPNVATQEPLTNAVVSEDVHDPNVASQPGREHAYRQKKAQESTIRWWSRLTTCLGCRSRTSYHRRKTD